MVDTNINNMLDFEMLRYFQHSTEQKEVIELHHLWQKKRFGDLGYLGYLGDLGY